MPSSWPCSTSSVRDDKIYVTTSCVCQSLSERLCHLLLLLRYCCMRSAVALALSRTSVGPWSMGPEVMWVSYNVILWKKGLPPEGLFAMVVRRRHRVRSRTMIIMRASRQAAQLRRLVVKWSNLASMVWPHGSVEQHARK